MCSYGIKSVLLPKISIKQVVFIMKQLHFYALGECNKREYLRDWVNWTGEVPNRGDIVRIYDSDYEEYSDQQVKFAHGVFGVDNWTKKTLTTLNFFIGCESEYSVEVIGNIYDTK